MRTDREAKADLFIASALAGHADWPQEAEPALAAERTLYHGVSGLLAGQAVLWPTEAAVQIPFRRAGGPLNLLVDSTGVKVLGDGEWQVRKHGPSRRRQWRKVHLAMDAATGDVRAIEFTSSREGDSPVLPSLLAQSPADQATGTVTADGAYDTRTCHSAIAGRGATAIIPIRKNGRAWKEDGPAA